MPAARKTRRMKPPPDVAHYVAREVFRRYLDAIEPELVAKLQRNVRRNYRYTIERQALRDMAARYLGMYQVSASTLPDFIGPRTGRYVDPADIRTDAFLAALKKRYPREPRVVLLSLAWYTIYYEYLR